MMKRCIICDRNLLARTDFHTYNSTICIDCLHIDKHCINNALNHPLPYVRTLANLFKYGKTCQPRGLRIKELLNYSIEVDYPFASIKDRNLPIKYIKREFQWYLAGDKFDLRIIDHATMWENIIQPNGSIASNYGQYLFGDQNGFQWVVDCLRRDPDSRQAIIPFANKDNIYENNLDQICTLGIMFNIREDKLNMTVIMRSNDINKGVTIDWVMFSWFWEMIAIELNIEKGTYTHFAASMHIYEDFYNKMISIIKDPQAYEITYPPITDAYDLIEQRFESDFGKWLTEVRL